MIKDTSQHFGKILTRRGLLFGGVVAFGSAALADAPLRVTRPMARPVTGAVVPLVGGGGPVRPEKRIVARPSLDAIIARADLRGVTGVVVADLQTGEILQQRDGAALLLPASVTKAVTALYALDVLGAGHRFNTRLLCTGQIENGVLLGDLILAGGGDPVLDTDDLAEMAQNLADSGLKEIRGKFMVWGGVGIRQIDPEQLPHLGYNPGVSELNLNFNRVHFEWVRSGGGYTTTVQARTDALRPAVTIAQVRLDARPAPIYAYEDKGGVDHWSVARSALGQSGSRWLPVRRPAQYAADVFRTLALGHGIRLPISEPVETLPRARVLVAYQSPELSEIIRDMLRFSTNLTAEVIGRAATQALGANADGLGISAAAMNGWLAASFGIRAAFVDHSGLGDASRISARDMVKILVAAQDGPLRPLLKSIPLVDDARESLIAPAGHVVAKTGTLNFVSALSGYMQINDGPDLAFAIFSADEERREAGKASGDEQPNGSITFNTSAKRMQQQILRHWGRAVVTPTIGPEIADMRPMQGPR